MQQQQKTNSKAVVSLVLGAIALVPWASLCAIPAIILGVLARQEIWKTPEVKGDGLAIAGIALGAGALALWGLLLFLMFLASRMIGAG